MSERPSVVRDWGARIYAYLVDKAELELTYAEIQDALELPYGSTFNNAMANARKRASEEDNCIAFCWANEDGVVVLTFNPNDEQLARCLQRRGNAINGQVVNYVDTLEWGARHAKNRFLRSHCRHAANAHRGAAMMTGSLNAMTDELLDQVLAP